MFHREGFNRDFDPRPKLSMENGGRLDEAQKLAKHSDPRTTKLYDRSGDTVRLDEIEKIRF